jgi:hypothetical protein
MRIPPDWLEKLKLVNFKKTGEMLSDLEANQLGLDILNYLELVGSTPPDENS